MNKNNYRLVFSRVRDMLVAVEEIASAAGRSSVCGRGTTASCVALFTLRQIAFAALALLGVLPSWSDAQIVAGSLNAPCNWTMSAFDTSATLHREAPTYYRYGPTNSAPEKDANNDPISGCC
jgi:Extended Signal Peptide of Type V secretion system